MKHFWLDPFVNLKKDGYTLTPKGPSTHSSNDYHDFDNYFHKLTYVGYFPEENTKRILGLLDLERLDEEIKDLSGEDRLIIWNNIT